jgi:hypothetical protein
VTSAIGYVRLQAESVALVHLLLHDPTQADAWYQAGLSGDGRAFYRSTQSRLMQYMKELHLDGAYDWGSEHALHVRIFPVLRAHVVEHRPGSRAFLWLRDHEFDREAPKPFLEAFVRILAAQAHVLKGLRLGRPEMNTQSVADMLGGYAQNVLRLSEKLYAMPD